MTRLRAGIVGSGFMGRVHARAIRAAGAELIGVVGSRRPMDPATSTVMDGVTVFDRLQQLLSLQPDVVHVCTPNHLHHDHVLAVIASKSHVVCEKPLATSLVDARAMRRAAGEAGVIATVPFVYRFYDSVREIRRRIASDPHNRLWLLHGGYLQDWLADRKVTNWRVDPLRGGPSRVFGDIGVHWCDLVEFVTGQRIVELAATMDRAFERAGGPAQNLTEDGAAVLIKTDRGAIGSVVFSQASAGRKNRLWFSLDGPGASYAFEQEHPEEIWLGDRDGHRMLSRDPGFPAARGAALPAGHPSGYQQCFDDFVADTYRAIGGGLPDGLPTFAEGERAAELTDAVCRSVTQHSWVTVDEATGPGSADDPARGGPPRLPRRPLARRAGHGPARRLASDVHRRVRARRQRRDRVGQVLHREV